MHRRCVCRLRKIGRQLSRESQFVCSEALAIPLSCFCRDRKSYKRLLDIRTPFQKFEISVLVLHYVRWPRAASMSRCSQTTVELRLVERVLRLVKDVQLDAHCLGHLWPRPAGWPQLAWPAGFSNRMSANQQTFGPRS